MFPRFHAPDARWPGQLVALPDEEAAHLTRVLRLKPGDHVRVFDGAGGEFAATVESATKKTVAVRVGEAAVPAAELTIDVTLVQAVLKGDKMDDVVRDAVMMGVRVIRPVVTARSETSLALLVRARRQQRWQRIAVVSAKQCGRAVVPQVGEPVAFDALMSELAATSASAGVLMCVEPGAVPHAESLSSQQTPPDRRATVLVGPEGGWSPDELTQGATAARLMTLRGATLRADAMPVVALAGLLATWGEL